MAVFNICVEIFEFGLEAQKESCSGGEFIFRSFTLVAISFSVADCSCNLGSREHLCLGNICVKYFEFGPVFQEMLF